MSEKATLKKLKDLQKACSIIAQQHFKNERIGWLLGSKT